MKTVKRRTVTVMNSRRPRRPAPSRLELCHQRLEVEAEEAGAVLAPVPPAVGAAVASRRCEGGWQNVRRNEI